MQVRRSFHLIELTQSDVLDGRPTLVRASFKELLRIAVGEALDHTGII